MKKRFFLILLIFPTLVHAEAITNLEVLNGTLSRKFETNNNTYSVLLDDNEKRLKLTYTLKDDQSTVEIKNEEYQEAKENVTTLEVTNPDGTKETYTFYLEKETVTPVFSSQKEPLKEEQEIPNLKYYVGGVCLCIILFLYKIIMIGFPKKK